MTTTELAEHMAVCAGHSADDYNLAQALATTVAALKENPDAPNDLGPLDRPQAAKVIGLMLSLLTMHELNQDDHEGAYE